MRTPSDRRRAGRAVGTREGVLTRYLEILGTAHAGAVVAVEREITRTAGDIRAGGAPGALLELSAPRGRKRPT